MLRKVLIGIPCVLAVLITVFVLFIPPQPGVADQGDFQRIMDITGLQETDSVLEDAELRFYQYTKTEYKMVSIDPLRFLGIIPSSSMLYPIVLARVICKALGMETFNTRILAAVYALIYVFALQVCLRWSGIRRKTTSIFFIILSLLVLMDGNYLVWFNSLYGEPMMIAGLLLFMASILYISSKESLGYGDIVMIVFSAFLFLGSKAQCITALPFIVLIIVRTVSLKKSIHPFKNRFVAIGVQWVLPLILLIFYTGGIFLQQSRTCGVDTKYNAVFYGILKNSNDPEKDLEMLGLSEELAVEAGKHAYLPHDDYVKYIPWSEITEKEFNQKISNMKLVQFYLGNPKRLLDGMKYTAEQSFQTGTFLGKFEKDDVPEPTHLFKRFTLWSDVRSTLLPKALWFIILVFLAVFVVSAFEYIKKRNNTVIRLRIELLWAIMAIGTFQFPMPFVGNGEADTAKQLFLFNFTFDILVIVACTWVFSKLFFSNIDDKTPKKGFLPPIR